MGEFSLTSLSASQISLKTLYHIQAGCKSVPVSRETDFGGRPYIWYGLDIKVGSCQEVMEEVTGCGLVLSPETTDRSTSCLML